MITEVITAKEKLSFTTDVLRELRAALKISEVALGKKVAAPKMFSIETKLFVFR